MNKNSVNNLDWLIGRAAEQRGLTTEIATRVAAITGTRVYRQQVQQWLNDDATKRIEPRLSIGLALLQVQAELRDKNSATTKTTCKN